MAVSPSVLTAASLPAMFLDHRTLEKVSCVGNSITTLPVLKLVTIVRESLADETTRFGS